MIKLLKEEAYDKLVDMISRDELILGQVYSETQLAESLGISRTPVRDALQRLNQDGYIDILPGRGFRIHEITNEDINEIMQVRSAIEGYGIYILAQNKESKEGQRIIQELSEIVEEQEKIASGHGDIQQFVELDQQYHDSIAGFCNNKVLYDIFLKYSFQMRNLASHSLLNPSRLKEAQKEHKMALEAISAGRADDAYAMILYHLRLSTDVERPKHFDMNK